MGDDLLFGVPSDGDTRPMADVVDVEDSALKVLDLFAGLRGWSQPSQDRGHEVFSVDFDKKFDVSLHADILELNASQLPWKPDVILASPPCEGFSVMMIGRNWTKEHQPKTEKAIQSMRIVEKTIALIDELQPRFFVIENPRAKLRKLPMMQRFDRQTVTYCQYGETRMKPTDLWGGFPPSFCIEEACKNSDPCHVRAPRGSRTGTQGMNRELSAKIPYALALAVCEACERDIEGGPISGREVGTEARGDTLFG